MNTLMRPAIMTPMPKSPAVIMSREPEIKGAVEIDLPRGQGAAPDFANDMGCNAN